MFNRKEFTLNLLVISFPKPPATFTLKERKYEGNQKEIFFVHKYLLQIYLQFPFQNHPQHLLSQEPRKALIREIRAIRERIKIYSKFTCNFLSKTTRIIYFHKSCARLSSVKSVKSVRDLKNNQLLP